MTHSPSHTEQEQPSLLTLDTLLRKLEALWLETGDVSEQGQARSQWTLAKMVSLSGSLYAILARVTEFMWDARTMAREGDWTQVDELAMEGWEELRAALGALFSEQFDTLMWFELLEDLDAHIVSWLTDPSQLERVRDVLEQLEWRVDRLIGHLLDMIFDQTEPGSPLMRIMAHRADIERWVSFGIERLLDLKST